MLGSKKLCRVFRVAPRVHAEDTAGSDLRFRPSETKAPSPQMSPRFPNPQTDRVRDRVRDTSRGYPGDGGVTLCFTQRHVRRNKPDGCCEERNRTHCNLSPSFRSIFSSPYKVLSVLHCGPFDAALIREPRRPRPETEERFPPQVEKTSGFASSAAVEIDIAVVS